MSDNYNTAERAFARAREMLMGKTVVLPLSGGQDSTTCLYLAKTCGAKVHAITINYGQRHYRELEAASIVAWLARVESHEILHMTEVLKGTSPLVSKEVLEQYTDHQSLPGGIEKTFVPMRNALFLTIAANRAAVLNADYLMIGVSQEDYGGYPDCRVTFLGAFLRMMAEALGESVESGPDLYAPLVYMTKCETVRLASLLPGCLYPDTSSMPDLAMRSFHYGAMAYTHTAYDGAYPPTGHDHATLLRAKGFEEAGIPDPLVTRAVDEGLMERPNTPNYQPRSIPDNPPAVS